MFYQTLIAIVLFLCTLSFPAQAETKMNFWKCQKKGANYFNLKPDEQWFKDAKKLGLQWVRLTYDKWKPTQRDFLIGNADHYQGLIPQDFKRLKQALDWAAKHQIKVVIAPLSLPGNRWSQNNGNKPDLRLWKDKKYWLESAQFWQDLARQLKGHPAVYAYNLINEPTPERKTGLAEHGKIQRYQRWYKKFKGSSHDLVAFYQQVITSIRKVDSQTPIMLDAGWYAQPDAFTYWPRLKDDKILYAFHMYEPYEFTNHKNFKGKKYSYPGMVPYADQSINWGKVILSRYFDSFFNWAHQQGLKPHQIVASEFGCFRRNKGCREYLSDLIAIFNQKQIHWAFYSYREDQWHGYDYELGSSKVDWRYWEAVEKGDNSAIKRKNTPLFEVLRREFKH